jgi:hypothetical protein
VKVATTQAHKIEFVAEFYDKFNDSDQHHEWFEMNDLGFTLGYAIHHGIVPATEQALHFVLEAWAAMLYLTDTNRDADGDDTENDIGYETFEQMDFQGENDV